MKRAMMFVLLAAMVLCLCACGGKDAPAQIDGEALASELLESGAFSVELTALPESKAGVFYTVDTEKLSGAVMHHASGTSKEQLAVFTAADETAAGEIVTVLQGLTAEWIEADRNYAPEEVPKLEKAVLRQSGVYVIYVVASDADAAARVVDKHL